MNKTLTIAATLALFAGSAGAVVIVEDHFAYTDGSLVGAAGSNWATHSGTGMDLQVVSGQAVVEHGTPSEDANLPFSAVGGNIYFGCQFSVDDLGSAYSGADNEYFIHFRTGTNFSARVDIVPPSASGDFSVGIASDESTADATWATDLTFGVTYTLVVKYDQDANIATLWIDPSIEADTSITGEDRPDPGDSITSIALRQSDSSQNETIRVDDVVVATTFADIVANVPVELQGFSIE